MSEVTIALLRGINLGRARRIAMADLRAALERHGHAGARTYLQSGNVILPGKVGAAALERLLADAFGMEIGVVVRTRDELASAIARDPLADVVTDPKRYHVTFLSGDPDPAAVRELEAADVAPERLVADGRELYAWYPDGMQRSRLAGLLAAAKLGVTATARNWNTATKLLELADEA